jgi:hypothetical protein
MRIAYIISAYKAADLLIRLVHRLHTPTSIILIHVDKRTDHKQYTEMIVGVKHLTNVVFLKRHNCHWGDFGHVRATLKGLAYLCDGNVNFDHVFLLTGQDYPIKPNTYIESLLSKESGREFLSYYVFPNKAWGENGGMRRIEQWHFRFLEDWPVKFLRAFVHFPSEREFNSKVKSLIYSSVNKLFAKRTLPGNMKPFGGPGYWCLTRACAEFIHDFVQKNSRFIRFFRYVDIPDEIFFHTIILNSSFAPNVVNDDLRCIDISEGRGPRIWQKRDLEILAQSNGLFARKFDSAVDREILDMIDAKLLSQAVDFRVLRPLSTG